MAGYKFTPPKIDLDSFYATIGEKLAPKAPVSSIVSELMAAAPPGSLTAQTSQGSTPSAGGKKGTANLGGPGGASFQKFVNAIAKQESGGNYQAVNKSSGALGKYQILSSNIPSWSKAALGHSISPQKFLSSPALQEKVARHQLANYFKKYGAEGASQAWYGGEGSVGKTSRSGGKGYPSVGGYSDAIKRRMGR